jgi:predicted ATPase
MADFIEMESPRAKISSIELNGFKSFISDTLTLGQLTLLTGLNSSGKSSVIQAIQLLRNARNGKELYLDGHGELEELVNPYGNAFDIKLFHNVFHFGNISFASTEVANEQYPVKIRFARSVEEDEYINNYNHKNAFDSSQNGRFQGEGSKGAALMEYSHERFPDIIYIAADRFGPTTSISIEIGNTKLGSKGENLLKCIEKSSNFILNDLVKHENSEGNTLLFNLKAWLGVISPNVKFDHFIQPMSDSSYSTFNGFRAKNVGFGLSYTLPVIAALLIGSTDPNSIVIIENPEAHLHPKGQTEMARLIALCVEAGVQVIVETHSDHLFDGIRIFAKNSKTNFHEKVKTYWFELDKNRNTEVHEVVIDENGRIPNAPQGLFDQFEINASKLL